MEPAAEIFPISRNPKVTSLLQSHKGSLEPAQLPQTMTSTKEQKLLCICDRENKPGRLLSYNIRTLSVCLQPSHCIQLKNVSECDFKCLETSNRFIKASCTEAGGEWMEYVQHHKLHFHFSHAASNCKKRYLGEATSSLCLNSVEVSQAIYFYLQLEESLKMHRV